MINKLSTINISKATTLLIAIASVMFINVAFDPSIASAVDMRRFDPGNIMSDAVMSNSNTMSVRDIQFFLESKNACNNRNIHLAAQYPHLSYSIKNGKFVCMAEENFNGQSAAQIIWEAARDYRINPQFLIVLLEKEQGLVSDTWPNHVQYRTATGFGCPDNAPCDTQYYGLRNQIRLAANLFREVLNGGWSNYPIGNNYVQYHPNTSCGGTVINIKNRATSALYRYTPYQPNQAALNAGLGTGDKCSAYGNRNTWILFTAWFGSTHHAGSDEIMRKYISMGSASSWLGKSLSSIDPASKGGLYQRFEGGKIYWHKNSGAWTIRNGAIDNRFASQGYEGGYIGYPRSDERQIPGKGAYQAFQGAQMYWSPQTGAFDIRKGDMFDRYAQLGYEGSYLGFPTSGEVKVQDGVYQSFENGRMYWRPGLRSMDMSKEFLDAYNKARGEKGHLKMPIRGMTCGLKNNGCWMHFEGGKIYSSPDTGVHDVHSGDMDRKYSELNWENGRLGYPINSEVAIGTTCGPHKDVKQEYQGGTLYWSMCSTPRVKVVYK